MTGMNDDVEVQDGRTRVNRPFPADTLEKALGVARAIQESNNGRPYKRVLLAQAMSLSQVSSSFRQLLRSSRAYGLTEGGENADVISLTEPGRRITKPTNTAEQRRATAEAVLRVPKFAEVFRRFDNSSLPNGSFFLNQLEVEFGIPRERTEEFRRILEANGRFAGIVRDAARGPIVVLGVTAEDSSTPLSWTLMNEAESEQGAENIEEPSAGVFSGQRSQDKTTKSGVLFLGHGKNTKPLEQLKNVLDSFKVPYKVAVAEPNLGRPIPTKVREVMNECSAAILIFTADEKFHDEAGNEVWRPSENAVFELGAASYAYDGRVVIFKEDGIKLPSNFESIGRIDFEKDNLAAKGTDLLKELIALGLVQLSVPSAA